MDTPRYYLVPLTTFCGVLGFWLGGPWVWLGFVTYPVLAFFDIVLPRDLSPRKVGSTFLIDLPLYMHLLLMFALYEAFIRSAVVGINPLTGDGAAWQIFGSLASLVWMNAVPTVPVTHELMHRRHWLPRRISQILNTFFGDPNRDIAHINTHHIHLDTAEDSDSARRGETVYAFMFRASWGSYKDAALREARRLRRGGHSPWYWTNRSYQQVLLLSVLPLLCLVFAGGVAMAVCAASMVGSKLFLEALNYFQHYGLVRVPGGVVQKHHAWNHVGAVIRPIGLEITNHINHHLDSYTKFYDLRPEPEVPQMPSLFLCFMSGLIPPIWFEFIAKPRLKDWDQRFATPAERKLAMDANEKAGWPRWLEGDGAQHLTTPSSA